MAKTTKAWSEIRKTHSKLSPQRKADVDQRVAQEALELSLKDLRTECGFTQIEMAQALEMAQGAFSRLERREDHLVSTLRKVVRVLGGQLEISATFGDKRVKLS